MDEAILARHAESEYSVRGALPEGAKPLVTAYYAHRIMGYGLQTFEVAA